MASLCVFKRSACAVKICSGLLVSLIVLTTFEFTSDETFDSSPTRRKEKNVTDISKDSTPRRFIFEETSEFILPVKQLNCLNPKRHYPKVLVIGAKKAGTSSLMVFLSLHPNVQSPTQEVRFFSRKDRFRHGYRFYKRHMPLSCTADVTFEKTPSYFVQDNVPKRVHDFNPDMKLIVMVKDPVARIASDYAMYRRFQTGENRPQKLLDLREVIMLPNGSINAESSLIKHSLYASHLSKWLQYFPSEQLLILDGDSFVRTNPAVQLRQVESFIGLPAFFEENLFSWNNTKGFFCLKDHGCMPDAKGHQHEKMDVELQGLLKSFFRPHNLAFYHLTGREFKWDN